MQALRLRRTAGSALLVSLVHCWTKSILAPTGLCHEPSAELLKGHATYCEGTPRLLSLCLVLLPLLASHSCLPTCWCCWSTCQTVHVTPRAPMAAWTTSHTASSSGTTGRTSRQNSSGRGELVELLESPALSLEDISAWCVLGGGGVGRVLQASLWTVHLKQAQRCRSKHHNRDQLNRKQKQDRNVVR